MPTSNMICFIKDNIEIIREIDEPVKKIAEVEISDTNSLNNCDVKSTTTESSGSVSMENNEFEEFVSDVEQDIVDPHCVAENPYKVTFQDITSAAFMIKSGIECTPCTVSKFSKISLSYFHA